MNETTAASGLLVAPPSVAEAARAWAAPLVEAARPSFRALYLYGSALLPDFDKVVSDINLLLVTSELTFDRLDALAGAVAKARQTGPKDWRFAPLALAESQIRTSTDVFPLEFLDLAERRALLEGEDVLAGLRVGRDNLRHQCEFELRSKLVGLRQAFLLSGAPPGTTQELLARAAGGSAALFRHLLTLRGRPHPAEHEAIARAVAETYGVDSDALAGPFVARHRPLPDETAARDCFAAFLAALEALISSVDELPLA
jgi:hypothetical protein